MSALNLPQQTTPSGWSEDDLRALLFELREDNPLAIQALLKILTLEASTEIPSAAVTRTEHPRLLVNLSFINAHCQSDDEVKAVLLHECLHVLLGHCIEDKALTYQRHIALDALINSLIHRQLGPRYSGFMSRFYRDAPGIACWLRPMRNDEACAARKMGVDVRGGGEDLIDRSDADPHEDRQDEVELMEAWSLLYAGEMGGDELTALAEALEPTLTIELRLLLGDHEALEDAGGDGQGDSALSEALAKACEAVGQQWSWSGWGFKNDECVVCPWSQSSGAGGHWLSEQVVASQQARLSWRREVKRLLERIVIPSSARGLSVPSPSVQSMPVLSTTDRRAFLKTLWSPILPSADWVLTGLAKTGQVQVYLDVSGSMHGELPDLLAVLASFHGYIQRPLYAFSTEVVPAKIVRGELVAKTSGGTSIECVLRHVEKTRPRVALVVTDGYVEAVEGFRGRMGSTQWWAVVTPDGDLEHLQALGMGCVQLPQSEHRRGGSVSMSRSRSRSRRGSEGLRQGRLRGSGRRV